MKFRKLGWDHYHVGSLFLKTFMDNVLRIPDYSLFCSNYFYHFTSEPEYFCINVHDIQQYENFGIVCLQNKWINRNCYSLYGHGYLKFSGSFLMYMSRFLDFCWSRWVRVAVFLIEMCSGEICVVVYVFGIVFRTSVRGGPRRKVGRTGISPNRMVVIWPHMVWRRP